ncbi:hypothetical protein [Kribbella catacumbae]|uniref:hypothetical protein n=1 Tax=Kribbella catacumbae TaxID=460086 RepID=UPI000380014A|nr:hypothetical protein [Kribbella catacumbae]
MTQYRLLVRPEVMQQLKALQRAAESQQPGGLRDRELRALRLGLRALANGQEESFNGKRLRHATHDLSDCAEIKLSAIPESRGNQELGPSHRLLYREFEPEDGGPPYREVISFEPRKDDRPFQVAATRLGRQLGYKLQTLHASADSRTTLSPTSTGGPAPIRQPLPPDLRKALAAASNVAPAHGAVNMPLAGTTRPALHRDGPPESDRQR